MIKVFTIRRKWLRAAAVCAVVIVAVAVYFGSGASEAVSGRPTQERTIQLVTGEFSSKTADGRPLEAYRWDPATVYVNKGEKVKLSIYGVNGDSHPFVIEGLNVRGEVKKGKETVVSFQADKEGVYRLICLTHPDIAHNGPMVGYIVVD